MAKLEWSKTGDRKIETGLSKGVLYPRDITGNYPEGVVWNGLTGVSENPTGGDLTKLYADNMVYASLRAAETFGATVEAFMYPDEFAACDGSAELAPGVKIGQQARSTFGLCYQTYVGSDVETGDYTDYKIHIIYGASAAPSEKSYATINESPENVTFSWELDTTPVVVTGFKPTAYMEIDSATVDSAKLAALEKILYGDAATEARLPLPDEIKTLMTGA